MKALLTIAAAVLFAGTVLQAQTVQESKARYTVMMETRVAGGLTGNGDYEALEWTVAPGCTFFDRLSLRVPVELDVAMFPNAEPQRTYCMTGTLGLRYYHPYSNPDVILTRTLALTATFGVLLF